MDNTYFKNCTLCPKNCNVDRTKTTGFCGMPASIYAARASLHFWEEPIISGKSGSGTVFFSGCNLKCVFCQNHNIAIGNIGKEITIDRLVEIYFELKEKGALNINLVTPSHYVPQIAESLYIAKDKGLNLPIVYNTSSYEKVETLKLLDGLVDVYLPDLKYKSSELSLKYSNTSDYFPIAIAALDEMYRQVGRPVQKLVKDKDDISSILIKGMIVRHLILPGQVADSKKVLRYLHDRFGNDIYISIMNQYTPLSHVEKYPEINRKVSDEEYARVLRFADIIGIENGFTQEGEAASESFIPDFNCSGI